MYICYLGTAQINNTVAPKTAIVTIDELACGTNYTIKAGGIFINQTLAGPRLNLGTIFDLTCETIINQAGEGKIGYSPFVILHMNAQAKVV